LENIPARNGENYTVAERVADRNWLDAVAAKYGVAEAREHWLHQLQRAGIFSGTGTYLRKITSEVLLGVSEKLLRPALSASFDLALHKLTGRRRTVYFNEILPGLAGIRAGFPAGLRALVDTLRYGASAETMTSIDSGMRELSGGAKNPLNYPTRVLGGLTTGAQVIEASGELYRQATKAALGDFEAGRIRASELDAREIYYREHPTTEMQETIQEFAEYSTLTTRPDQILTVINKWRNLGFVVPDLKVGEKTIIPGGKLKPLKLFMPVANIAYNLVKMAYRYSPIGYADGIAAAIGERRTGIATPRLTDALARATIGSLFMLGVSMAVGPNITGEAPKSGKERELFYAQGKQPYSVLINGKWVGYLPLGHLAFLLSAIAAFNDTKGAIPPKRLVETAFAVSLQLKDEPFLRGTSDFLDSLGDPKKAARLYSSQATGLVPLSASLRNITQMYDPTIRNPQGLYERIMMNLPILSRQVPARITPLGVPAMRQGKAGLRALLPMAISPASNDPVVKELARLDEFPSAVGNNVTIGKQKLTLDRSTVDAAQVAKGTWYVSELKKLVASPAYQQMTLEDQKNAVQSLNRRADGEARGVIVSRLAQAGKLNALQLADAVNKLSVSGLEKLPVSVRKQVSIPQKDDAEPLTFDDLLQKKIEARMSRIESLKPDDYEDDPEWKHLWDIYAP
jgi:hypothetical protein